MGNFEIFSVGNPAFLIEIFMGLSRLWSSNDIYLFFGTGLILGLIWNSFQWAIEQDKVPFPAKGFVISIILVTGLLGPQSIVDVTVISKRDNSFQDVSNVPLLPAISGWLITNSISYLADGFAQAFSIVGVDNVWSAFSPIQHFVGLASVNYNSACTPYLGAENSYNMCKTVHIYLDDCYVTSNILEDGKSDPVELLFKVSPGELIDKIQTTNLALQTTYYLDKTGVANEGIMSSCANAYSILRDEFKSNAFQDVLANSSIVQGVDLTQVQIFVDQQTAQGTMTNAESSLTFSQAMFLKSQFADYFPNSDYGQQVAKGMFDTAIQRQVANAQKKEYWMENAEIMQSFFEALAVFLTPFIDLTLAVSSKGLLAVGQYMMVWVFVQMWSIMIVLVNGFMGMAMTGRFTEGVLAGESSFSLTAIDSQFATANSYIAMGGMLYTFIPAICVSVMYRGVHAMQGMASKSMQDPSIKAERFAPDTGATINHGAGAFGNQTITHQNNTGGSVLGGKLTSSNAGSYTVGDSTGVSAGVGKADVDSNISGVSAQRTAKTEAMHQSGLSGSTQDTVGGQTQYTVSNMEQAMAAATQSLSDAGIMSVGEGQRAFASGAIGISADGQLGLSTPDGKFAGMKVGADVKAAMGIDENASKEQKQSLSDTLQKLESQSTQANNALATIKTAGDVTSSTNSAQFTQSAGDGAQLAKVENNLRQQSQSLSEMQTSSGQFSQGVQFDYASLAQKMSNTSIDDFVKNSNPELSDVINNKEYQLDSGKTGTGSDYLAQQEAKGLMDRENVSANKGGEARASALMDLIKENDKIDINADGGVDIQKEQKDNAINEGLFGIMASNNIVGANQGSELYQQRGEQLAGLAERQQDLTDKYDDKDVLPAIPATGDIYSPNSAPLTSASEVISDTNLRNTNSASLTSKGPEDVVAARKNDAQANDAMRDTVAHPTQISSEAQGKADLIRENLAESTNQTLVGMGEGALDFTSDLIKGDASANMDQFIVSSTNNGTIPSSVQMDYDTGMGKLDSLPAVNTKAIENGLSAGGQDYKSMLALVSGQGMVDSILGGDGKDPTLGNSTFTGEQRNKLEAANAWYQDYSQSENKSPQIEAALVEIGNQEGDVAGSYIDALDNRGMIDSARDKNSPKSEIAHALSNVINGDSDNSVNSDLSVTGRGDAFHSIVRGLRIEHSIMLISRMYLIRCKM